MKALRGIIKTIVILLLLGGLGWGGYQYYLSRQKAGTASAAPTYTRAEIATGSLTQSVTGTGSLKISKTSDVTTTFPVTIKESLVREGEFVKAGTPIAQIDENALKTAILTMNTELSDIDASIASIASSYTGTDSITPSAAGRVKQIYAKAGSMTAEIMNQYGSLAVLSCDGRMRVSISYAGLVLDDTVTIRYGNKRYTGTVSAINEDTADITFSDAAVLPGDTVEVLIKGEVVAEGQAVINMPLLVSTTLDGYVDSVNVKINGNVSKRTTLFEITHIPASTEYDMLVSQRADKLAALEQARQTLISGVITADIDGIVATAPAVSQEDSAAGTALATIYAGDAMQMVISVDELDIIRVQVGQKVQIAMDAVTDKTYNATVSYISQIGTPSSGVTTYAVTLDVESDEQLKMGMNGTATIVVQKIEDAVLVPLTAVQTGRRGTYVWKYTGETGDDSDIPGEQVYIATGLSNEDYAEVTSGLKAGDVVLVMRSASGASGASDSRMSGGMDLGGMNFAGMPGGTPPEGGLRQQRDNSNRTNNGGSRNP